MLTFTPEDNLFDTWKAADDGRIKNSILPGDSNYFNYVAQQYRTLHGGKDCAAGAQRRRLARPMGLLPLRPLVVRGAGLVDTKGAAQTRASEG